MSKYIELSHILKNNMFGYRFKQADGTIKNFTLKMQPFITREQSRPLYKGQAEFELTELKFEGNNGTYIDSPYHRYLTGCDLAKIPLDDLIMEGFVVDARNTKENQEITLDEISLPDNITNKALLINFGWDKYWEKEKYFDYPYIGLNLIKKLVEFKIKLIGVDTLNIDNTANLSRPAHSMFLEKDILIIENMINLDKLYNRNFKLFAIPLKIEKGTAIPVRVFAEIID